MRANRAKQALLRGEATIGTWLSLASPMAARFLARLPFDWLTIDLEHSPADWETMALMIATIADGGSVPLVRIPSARHDHVKRALDAGAAGIVVPMVMDRPEAEAMVAAMKYPPRGNRSVGGSLHALSFDASADEYYARADDEILVVLQCEHITAVERADEIFSVPGIDAIFVGPNDLRASMRSADGQDPTPAAFEAALDRILAACLRHHVAAGIHCFSPKSVDARRRAGWRFLAHQSDLAFLFAQAQADLEQLGRSAESLAKY